MRLEVTGAGREVRDLVDVTMPVGDPADEPDELWSQVRVLEDAERVVYVLLPLLTYLELLRERERRGTA